jgi:hypothetical protein
MRCLPTLCLFVSSACGPTLVSPAEYCEELATIRCDAEPVCCTYPELLSTDQEACTRTMLTRCNARFGGRAFDDGRASFDPVNARLALDVIANEASTCGGLAETPEFVTGHAGIGSDCSTTELDTSGVLACRSGLVCNLPEGVCAEPISNPVGGPCDGPDECAGGLTCFDGVCAPRVAEGSACDQDFDCSTFSCDEGICGPRRPPLDESAWNCVGGR